MDHATPDAARLPELPGKRVDRLLAPVTRFMHVEAAGGIVLLACTIVALVLANSPWADPFARFWKMPVGFQAGTFEVRHSLQHWINDGLMAIFFFVVGLEVKRELVLGELRHVRKAALPVAGAIGGMLVPAAIYLAVLSGREGMRGFGIPMATDIAFVVGCLALLGSRVPHGLRIMFLSLAIVDDVGAILIIAFAYTESIGWLALALGIVGLATIVGLLRLGVRGIGVYTVMGVAVWFAFYESGIHATIAGVLLGLITPTRGWVEKGLLGRIVTRAGDVFTGEETHGGKARYRALRHLEVASREAISPLERLETKLHGWVGFVIMPLFALANAGVPVRLAELGEPVSVAVIAGLVVGKPVGIVLFCLVAVKLGLARLPESVGWPLIAAGSCLAGIGFTMAIFIAGLALDAQSLDTAKVGILAASAICATLGMTLLVLLLPRRQ